MDIIEYFLNNMSINLMKAITDPYSGCKVRLLIRLCKIKKKTKMFFYFWEEHPYLFDSRDLLACIKILSRNSNFKINLLSKIL